MLKIRFTQTGKKNDHNYRLVVKETRSKRDGDAIEFLGYYHPNQPEGLKINSDRLNYWINNGAQLTPSAQLVVKDFIQPKAPKLAKSKNTKELKPAESKAVSKAKSPKAPKSTSKKQK